MIYSVGRQLGEDSNDRSAGENSQQLEHTQTSENVVVDVNGTTRNLEVSVAVPDDHLPTASSGLPTTFLYMRRFSLTSKSDKPLTFVLGLW